MESDEDIPSDDPADPAVPAEPDEWVTLSHYHGPADAHLDRIRLESEGVACNLLFEQFTTILPYDSMATGGICLQVPKSQFADADAIVREKWKSENVEQITCPQCGGAKITRLDLAFPKILFTAVKFSALFILGMVLPFFYKVPMRCSDCRHEWSVRSQIFSRWKGR